MEVAVWGEKEGLALDSALHRSVQKELQQDW